MSARYISRSSGWMCSAQMPPASNIYSPGSPKYSTALADQRETLVCILHMYMYVRSDRLAMAWKVWSSRPVRSRSGDGAVFAGGALRTARLL